MERRLHREIRHGAAVLALTLAAAGLAQGPDEAIMISPDFVVEGRVVTGAPYSAQAITSVTQTLPTGSQISTQMKSLVARDAEGRTRRVQTIPAIGPWALLPPPGGREEPRRSETPTVILIQDPVKQLNYMLDPVTRVAGVTRQREGRYLETERRNRELESRAHTEAGNAKRTARKPRD